MPKALEIPCIVDGRALWNAPYSAALMSVSVDRVSLVWPSRQDLVVQAQSIEGDELKAFVRAKLLQDRGDNVLVEVKTKGQTKEVLVSKQVLRPYRKISERKNSASDRKIGRSA